MSDRKWTTEEIRNNCTDDHYAHNPTKKEFDLWLAEGKTAVWLEGHRAGVRWERGTSTNNPYREGEGE